MFEEINNIKLNYRIGDRRNGDITSAYADTEKVNKTIGWHSKNEIN